MHTELRLAPNHALHVTSWGEAERAPHTCRRYKRSQSTYHYFYGTYVTRAPLYIVYVSALYIPTAA